MTSVKNILKNFKKIKKFFLKDLKNILEKNIGLKGWVCLMSECLHGCQKDE
jgi:hypothetical protein